jgi:serine/threonine-protein kinase
MGSVHEARDPSLGRSVALKVLHPHLLAAGVAGGRFVREGIAAAKVRHPNVVEVFDVGMDGGIPFMTMELLDGEDLATALARRGRIPLVELVDYMLPVCGAIAAAHAASVVHRDLKPSNIFLARDRHGTIEPKVFDFGMSKIEGDAAAADVTLSSMVLGTLRYMAPEQTRGAKHATAKSDQYALGTILYECATGQRPFAGEDAYSLMHAIVTEPVPRPRAIEPSLPEAFDVVVERAMSRIPRHRYPSVLALGEALMPFASPRRAAEFARELASPQMPPRTLDAVATPTTLETDSTLPLLHARPKALRVGAAVLAAAACALVAAGASVLPRAPSTRVDSASAAVVTSTISAAPIPRELPSAPAPLASPTAQVAPIAPSAPAAIPAASPRARRAPPAPMPSAAKAAPPQPDAIGPNGAPILPD